LRTLRVKLSTRAVQLLDEHDGRVPTVQSEEVFLVHAHVPAAAGSDEARGYAEKAAQIVREKTDSLKDPALQTSFLERVRLSRDVMEAPRSGRTVTVSRAGQKVRPFSDFPTLPEPKEDDV
jgi:hypothetical protein